MSEPTDSPPETGQTGVPPRDNVVRVAFGAARPMRADACPRAPEKLAVFTRLVEAGMVLVHFDTRVPGARVPPQFAGDVQLGLNFSHRFGLPDFVFDDAGVRASLSFQGQPFFCDVPWSAVFMMRSYVTDDVALFSESMPRELAKLLQQAETESDAGEEARGGAASEGEVADHGSGAGTEPAADDAVGAGSDVLAPGEVSGDAPEDLSPSPSPPPPPEHESPTPRPFGLRLVKSE